MEDHEMVKGKIRAGQGFQREPSIKQATGLLLLLYWQQIQSDCLLFYYFIFIFIFYDFQPVWMYSTYGVQYIHSFIRHGSAVISLCSSLFALFRHSADVSAFSYVAVENPHPVAGCLSYARRACVVLAGIIPGPTRRRP